MSDRDLSLNTLAFDPEFAARFADWRDRLAVKNAGSDAEFWLELVPFVTLWRDRVLALHALSRPAGKTYSACLKSFLETSLPGIDKADLTAALWLGDADHLERARAHLASLNWAGDRRKLNSPRSIRNAVQKDINREIEEAEAADAATARAEGNGRSVEEQEELDEETSIQAMLEADEVSAEDKPESGVIGGYIKRVKHNTLWRRCVAVRGDDWMRETAMRSLVELLDVENKRRAADGKQPLTMGAWFKSHKF